MGCCFCRCIIKALGGDFRNEKQIWGKEHGLSKDALKLVDIAFDNLNPLKILDVHVHLIGTKTEQSGGYVHPNMDDCCKCISFLKKRALMQAAVGYSNTNKGNDLDYVHRLVSLFEHFIPDYIQKHIVSNKNQANYIYKSIHITKSESNQKANNNNGKDEKKESQTNLITNQPKVPLIPSIKIMGSLGVAANYNGTDLNISSNNIQTVSSDSISVGTNISISAASNLDARSKGGGVNKNQTQNPNQEKNGSTKQVLTPRAVILGLDEVYDRNKGIALPDLTSVHTPHEYVDQIVNNYPNLFALGPSIHPFRKDALELLEYYAKKGCKIIKWIPNSMGIDPMDPQCDAYYDKMRQLDLTLITHTGAERALDDAGYTFDELGNPLRFRRALDKGVKIIMAHCASEGLCQDFDAMDAKANIPAIDNNSNSTTNYKDNNVNTNLNTNIKSSKSLTTNLNELPGKTNKSSNMIDDLVLETAGKQRNINAQGNQSIIIDEDNDKDDEKQIPATLDSKLKQHIHHHDNDNHNHGNGHSESYNHNYKHTHRFAHREVYNYEPTSDDKKAKQAEEDGMEHTDGVDIFLRMMRNEKYKGLLFGDISAMTGFRRLNACAKIMKATDIHNRLIYGSDYPIPAMNFAVWYSKVAEANLIENSHIEPLRNIYQFNPSLADFVLKRIMRISDNDGNICKFSDCIFQRADLIDPRWKLLNNDNENKNNDMSMALQVGNKHEKQKEKKNQ